MTMIDEQTLTTALADAANAFAVSNEAVERIVSATEASEPKAHEHRWPSFAQQGRARNILVAAALVLVVGAISLPIMRDEGGHGGDNTAKHPSASSASRSESGVYGTSAPLSSQTTQNTFGQVTRLGVTGSANANSGSSLAPKIESSGSVHLTVGKGEVQSALAKLSRLATNDRGYVLSSQANSSTNGTGNFSSATIVLQVPQRTFTTLITQVLRDGRATLINSTSTNVTSQYVDLQARISALKVSRQQYLTIMTRATSISGILAVQNQLDSIQSQIEQLQGQMNVLNNETSYGTLTVKLAAAGQTPHETHHRSGISSAWHDSIGGFVSGFEWLIRIAGPALFVVLVLGALFMIARVAWRADRRRRM